MHHVAGEIRPWCERGIPSTKNEWKKLLGDWLGAVGRDVALQQWGDCAYHSQLAHYWPASYNTCGKAGLNTALHNKKVGPDTARVVGRLLAGGQGLRGADTRPHREPTQENCCVWCLEHGIRVSETLKHFTFDCKGVECCRRGPRIAVILRGSKKKVFRVNRDVWGWRDQQAILRFFREGMALRHEWMRPGAVRGMKTLQERLQFAWACSFE